MKPLSPPLLCLVIATAAGALPVPCEPFINDSIEDWFGTFEHADG